MTAKKSAKKTSRKTSENKPAGKLKLQPDEFFILGTIEDDGLYFQSYNESEMVPRYGSLDEINDAEEDIRVHMRNDSEQKMTLFKVTPVGTIHNQLKITEN
jgi:hypothetical protein